MEEKYKWYTMDDIYKYCKGISLPLLSTYSSPFWGEYIMNYERYDRFFNGHYKSFRFYDQDPFNNGTISEVTMDFINDVQDYLLLNDKKYTELFKIQLLNIGNISYDFYSEQVSKSNRKSMDLFEYSKRLDKRVDTIGSRDDYNRFHYGSATVSSNDTSEHKRVGYDSDSYLSDTFDDNSGTKTSSDHSDDESRSIGQQTNTSSFTTGERSDTESRNENADGTITNKGYNRNPINNIEIFRKYWNGYEFYGNIFKDIAKEVLLV